jgi:hypothetical protein
MDPHLHPRYLQQGVQLRRLGETNPYSQPVSIPAHKVVDPDANAGFAQMIHHRILV